MTHADETTAPAVTDRRKGVRAAVAGAAGTALEWYDYGLFGTATALYLAPLFFSGADPVFALMASFATFAVGFIARPFGGIILGHFGDRFGRKSILIFTILLSGIATFLSGCLPTNAQVGVWAPVLLVVLRLIQGFGAGAELAGAMTYVNESAEPRNRGFLTSFASASSVIGLLMGTGTYAILNAVMTQEAMLAGGWRIPFLASAVLVIITIVLRSRIEDSTEFTAEKEAERQDAVKPTAPIITILRTRKLAVLSAFLALTTLSFGGYVIFTYSLSYLTNTLGMPAQISLLSTLIGGVIAVAACIFFGWLSDRVGYAPLIIGGAIGSALFAFPFFLLVNTQVPALVILAIAVGYSLCWGMASGAQGLFLPALFETRYRFSGVAISRELSSALVGGPAPLVATALVAALNGAPWLVAGALVVAGAISIVGVVLGRREAGKVSRIEMVGAG